MKIITNAGKKAKKEKKKKDPNAPKKAPTPFFIFLAEERPKLKAQGKKKMRMVGSVEIPQKAFMAVLQINN